MMARRVRIGRLVLLAAIAALLAVPPVFVNHPIGYVPLVMYAFTLLFSWGYLRVTARGLSVEYDAAEYSCPRGSSVELPVVLKNRSRLPVFRARPRMYVKNPHGVVESEVLAIALVDARDGERMSVKVRLGHVGVYVIGLQGVVLYDPLALFQTYKKVEGEFPLVSTPKDLVADAIEFSDLAMHESRTPVRTVLSDNVDYAGTRDYEYGDPLKSVHWKLSARVGDLQTRLFEASVNTKLSVVMDFHVTDYDSEDLMDCNNVIVEAALAVMRLAVRRNIEATLRYVDKQGADVSRDAPKREEETRFVAGLPLASSEVDGQVALDVVDREVRRFGGSDSIVLCTSEISRELVERLVEIRSGYVSVTVVLAVPRSKMRTFRKQSQGVMRELSNAHVACIVCPDASELEWSSAHE